MFSKKALTRGSVTILSFFLVNCSAYKDGAPCQAQNSLKPSSVFHGSAQDPSFNPPPYTFTVEDEDGSVTSSYTAGKSYFCELYFTWYNVFKITVTSKTEIATVVNDFSERLKWIIKIHHHTRAWATFLGGGTSCLYLHAIRYRSGGTSPPQTLKFLAWGVDQPPSPPHAHVCSQPFSIV